MDIPAFTPWLWLNIIVLALLLGFGWSLGCALWFALVTAWGALMSRRAS